MGLLRSFIRGITPKPVRRVKRSVRKVTHPTSLLTPRSVKRVRRSVTSALNPLDEAAYQTGKALTGRGRRARGSSRSRSDAQPPECARSC